MPRAVIAEQLGAVANYQLRAYDPGAPKPNQIRIAVRAAGVSFVDVLTAEGQFSLDTVQKNRVKIDDYEVPQTTKFTGDLKVFNPEKGRMKIFLGRTIPYVTGKSHTGSQASSSYSQLSVGLDSAFNVTFGKPLVIQTDADGPITVLVTRVEN